MTASSDQPRIAVACGGTGGHFYPGLAVAEQLLWRGCAVTLLISPKEVDQQAVKAVQEMEVITLPAVAMTRGQLVGFLRGFVQAYRRAGKAFQSSRPKAVLAMGGFTSAPPLLAARGLGSKLFLHESNSIPGRANRWLSRIVDRAFIGFASAAKGLHSRDIVVTGTPVRRQFRPVDPAACRSALGMDPSRPVVLVMGGSQGASGLNRLVIETLPALDERANHWQWLHLTGPAEVQQISSAYLAADIRAVVHPFLAPMHLALGAATVAISRAGASSLAELAAMRLPGVLVPYPAAVDDHQFHNARAFEQTNAARLLPRQATPNRLAHVLIELMEKPLERQKIQQALNQWHWPNAASNIAESMLEISGISVPKASVNLRGDDNADSGGRAPDQNHGSDPPKTRRTDPAKLEPVCRLGSHVVYQERRAA